MKTKIRKTMRDAMRTARKAKDKAKKELKKMLNTGMIDKKEAKNFMKSLIDELKR